MTNEAINFERKFAQFAERWSPKVVAQMNDCQFKLVRVAGEFIWHSHPDTDEAFLVLDGELTIHLRDRNVVLGPGEMFVVPRGTEHKPSAVRECRVMLVEPVGTRNTGDVGGDRTAPQDVWI